MGWVDLDGVEVQICIEWEGVCSEKIDRNKESQRSEMIQ